MIKEKFRGLVKFSTSRMPMLFIGVFLFFSGLKHMIFGASSFTAEFGLPVLMAPIAGIFLSIFGLAFVTFAVKPRFVNPEYKLPNYPGTFESEDKTSQLDPF